MLESMLKICIYTGINADVTLEDGRTHGRTECEDRARILKQNSQLHALISLDLNVVLKFKIVSANYQTMSSEVPFLD